MYPSLRTTSFKELYKLSKTLPKWLRFLWLGFLVSLEEQYLNIKTTQAVFEAVKGLDVGPSGVVPPVYSETGKDFFDEMRLSGPWKAQEDPSDSPQV